MILSDQMIRAAVESGDILIDPFDPEALGSNSYDVHLGDTLLTYDRNQGPLDCKKDNMTVEHRIYDWGFELQPGELYLASTKEYTETRKYVPYVDGKSSVGRLGITIHCTAGRGDVGFCGHWTLEIHVIRPVIVYAGMKVGQLTYHETGIVDRPYDTKPGAKYHDGRDSRPQASRMWRNFK